MIENDVDMILVEYFFYIQEMEWAIELCRKVKKEICIALKSNVLSTRNRLRPQWPSDQRVIDQEFLQGSVQSGQFQICTLSLPKTFPEKPRINLRMAKAGADIVGANCLFDPWIGLETVGGKMQI